MVEDRKKETLLPCYQELVLSGSAIVSDCWATYKYLEAKGFQHLNVNHSLNFVDPETGAYNNSM